MTYRDLLAVARAALSSVVMFISGAIVPLIGQILFLLAPAPILGCAIGFRRPMWRASIVAAISALLVLAIGGIDGAATYVATVGVSALAMTYMLDRRQSFERIVAVGAALMIVCGTGAALLLIGPPPTIAQALQHDLTASIASGEKFYGRFGFDLGIAPDLKSAAVVTILRLVPALFALSAALMVLVNLLVFWRATGGQQRIGYALFADLARWSTPEWLIWVLLVTGFGLFIPIAAVSTAALDFFICVAAIYFCQGLAIMSFYFRLLAMPGLARGLIYFITLLQPVLAIMVCTAGVFDLWIDFRRLKPPSSEARNLSDFL
jgi:uncharacterized protein YybS (DUF2232 family)